MEQVRITWNGLGGELGSSVVTIENDQSITDALVALIQGEIITAGDSFQIEEVA